MTRTKLVVIAAALVAAAGATWFVKGGSHATSSAATVPAAHAVQSAVAPAPAVAVSPRLAATAAAPQQQAVPLAADRVVARVNGTAITGRDLVAFGNAAPASQSMSREMYEALLERAIDRELVMQQARKQGITLDDTRKQQLDQVRAAQAARTPGDQGQIEWEARDAEGHLLLDTLLAREGVSALPTQHDVDAYYAQHRDELGDMPRANAELDIRQTLATEMAAAYRENDLAFRQRLRAAAAVERVD